MSAPHAKHRLLYVGPVGAVALALCVALPLLLVLAIADPPSSYGRHFGLGALAAAVVGLVGAWIFNVVAPMMGGVRLWLAAEPRASAPGDAARWRACPACTERVRADRSFCPSCGADLGSSEEE